MPIIGRGSTYCIIVIKALGEHLSDFEGEGDFWFCLLHLILVRRVIMHISNNKYITNLL